MLSVILQALYFMFPAYVANATPVFLSKINMGKFLDGPVDLGKNFMGKRIFGDHKTVKGFVFGTIAGVLVCLSQYFVSNIFEYSFYDSILIGFLLGFGALVGDSVKSFFKRRLGVKPGGVLPVFDQIDFVVGSLVLSSIAVDLKLELIIVILIVSPVLPLIANITAYFLGLKKVWW